jgi:hypothetical protein
VRPAHPPPRSTHTHVARPLPPAPGVFEGGIGEIICSHLDSAAAAAAEAVAAANAAAAAAAHASLPSSPPPPPEGPSFDWAGCQLAAALVATMADWPGWEAAARGASAAWEAARAPGGASSGAAGEGACAGGDAALPALHRLLLELAAYMPGLVVAAGAAAGACGGDSSGDGGSWDGGAAGAPGARAAAAEARCRALLEALMLVAHALFRLLEHGGRGARAALRAGLGAGGVGLSEEQIDDGFMDGRLDWVLLCRAAEAAAPPAPLPRGDRGALGPDDPGLEALPPGATRAVLRLLTPAACGCQGAHRFVNAAAAAIANRWAVSLGPGDVGAPPASPRGGGGGSGGGGGGGGAPPWRARERRAALRAKVLEAFHAVGGCGRLAALLDDCHDEVGSGGRVSPGRGLAAASLAPGRD